jgi:hypothetical protein
MHQATEEQSMVDQEAWGGGMELEQLGTLKSLLSSHQSIQLE